MLVFTGVYVCVKAKLPLVSFFSLFFFAPFPYRASLFTGAPQVVYRSVIILGGINCKNKNGELCERFPCCLFVFVFVFAFIFAFVFVSVFVLV